MDFWNILTQGDPYTAPQISITIHPYTTYYTTVYYLYHNYITTIYQLKFHFLDHHNNLIHQPSQFYSHYPSVHFYNCFVSLTNFRLQLTTLQASIKTMEHSIFNNQRNGTVETYTETLIPQSSHLVRTQAHTPMSVFASLRSYGDSVGEKGDCAVIALAVVTRRNYSEIHELLKKAGRRNRCGTPVPMQKKVLAQLGFALHDITRHYDGASVRSITPLLPDKGAFLIFTHKHVLAVYDGVCHDWTHESKRYVQTIYKVTDADEPIPMPERRSRNVVINYLQPTKAVWTIADLLFEDANVTPAQLGSRKWWSTFRARISAECQANGINKTTAAVQTGKWMADNGYHMAYFV